jgi:hypothetical protein
MTRTTKLPDHMYALPLVITTHRAKHPYMRWAEKQQFLGSPQNALPFGPNQKWEDSLWNLNQAIS